MQKKREEQHFIAEHKKCWLEWCNYFVCVQHRWNRTMFAILFWFRCSFYGWFVAKMLLFHLNVHKNVIAYQIAQPLSSAFYLWKKKQFATWLYFTTTYSYVAGQHFCMVTILKRHNISRKKNMPLLTEIDFLKVFK